MEFPRDCRDPAEMQALGRELGAELPADSVVGLSGDLGAGKTELVKGLAAGLGYQGPVTSPTFALLHEYPASCLSPSRSECSTVCLSPSRPHELSVPSASANGLSLYHLDFYRMERVEEVLDLGWDELIESGGITVAEWADRFPGLFPEEALMLRIEILPDGVRRVDRVG